MMRRIVALLVLSAGVLAVPAAASPDRPGPRVTRATLGNGLRIAIVEDHSVPVVRVVMRYRYGADNEPHDRDGLAHALEHMMFRGTHALSGTGLDELHGQLGADVNAQTGREDTEYYQMLPAGRLATALRIEADRMRGLTLRDADWTSERLALLEEIREAEARPRDVLEAAVRARAYAGAGSLAHTGTGTAAAMRAITTADLRRAYDTAYAPDNALLVIAGDAEPREALALAHEIFGGVRGHARITRATEPPVRRGFTVSARGGYGALVDVALEAHGMAVSDATGESVAATLLSPDRPALGTLLVDHGPCDSYVFDDDTELHGGMYHLVCSLRGGRRPDRAVAAVTTALRTLAAHPPHAAISRARRAYIDATAFQYDDLAAEAGMFGDTLSALNVEPRDLDRKASKSTDAQVAAVLRRWSVPLAVGISLPSTGPTASVTAKRDKSEPAPHPRGDERVVQPAWARSHTDDPPLLDTVPVSVFALANGVRVFVDHHPGNGTVYLRAGIDDPAAFASMRGRIAEIVLSVGTPRWPRERIAKLADERNATVELSSETAAHGHARDLPLMLDAIADAWRTPRPVPTSELRDFLAATIRPERFWIAITGDVDPDAVRAKVARAFAGWRVGPAPPVPSATAESMPAMHSRIIAVPGRRPTVRVIILQRAPAASDPDSDAFELLNEILGARNDFDTRLVRDLRVRRGLTYGVASFYGTSLEGFSAVAFECAPRDLAAARRAVYGVFDDLRTHPPSAAQLERARRKLAIAALLDLSSPDGRLEALAAARDHGVVREPQEVLRRLSAVSPEDAARVARTYFRRDRAVELDSRR